MKKLLDVLKAELLKIVDDIDTGNSYLTDEDTMNLIATVKQLSHTDEYCTKYSACNFLHISRATFDNLVAAGKIPKGEKKYAGDNALFWKMTDLIEYKNRNAKRS